MSRPRPTLPFRAAPTLLLGLALAAASAGAVEVSNLEHLAELHGRYAPGGDCSRQPRIVVGRAGFTFENGESRHKVARIDHAVSYGGNLYHGISQWMFPLYGAERPFLMTFNADEQRGVLTLIPHDRGWEGGPPFSARHQALVDASPYRRCE